jgi:N4-gp56 family major capsid protein
MRATMQDFTTGETTTSSTGISSVQGKYWVQEILAAAKKKMFFEQFGNVTNVQPGNKDVLVPLATAHLVFTDNTAESTARTMTQVDNLSTVTFTPSTHKFGASISKDVVRTTQVDVVRWAREEIIYAAALTIDQAFATALVGTSAPAAILYGGAAVSTATLVAGDVLTTDIVAKAQRYLKSNGWYPEPDKPFVLFIAPAQEEALLRDSQFTNAAEYGSNEVIMNGEIGNYLGVKVISTNQTPAYTTWGGGALAGHMCFMLKAKVSYGIAYGERPMLDFEYKKDEAEYRIYLDMAYQIKTLQENAIVAINVLDA